MYTLFSWFRFRTIQVWIEIHLQNQWQGSCLLVMEILTLDVSRLRIHSQSFINISSNMNYPSSSFGVALNSCIKRSPPMRLNRDPSSALMARLALLLIMEIWTLDVSRLRIQSQSSINISSNMNYPSFSFGVALNSCMKRSPPMHLNQSSLNYQWQGSCYYWSWKSRHWMFPDSEYIAKASSIFQEIWIILAFLSVSPWILASISLPKRLNRDPVFIISCSPAVCVKIAAAAALLPKLYLSFEIDIR